MAKLQNGNPDVVQSRQQTQTLQNAVVLRRISAATEPAMPVGQLVIWHDSTNSKVYVVYNDPTESQVKVELT